MARQTTIPVTLLTRFLGSGKTTLLNQMLADRRMRHAAVIINEFGSVSLDHDLVHKGSERYVVTTTGCLCCTATSDVRTSLFELQEMVHRGEAHPFDRVIVETTGLADPAPIVNSLVPGGAPSLGFRDHTIAKSFRLSNVVSTFDAEAGEAALDQHIEAWKQVAFADDVVIDGGRATRSKGRRDVPDNSHRTDTVRIAAPEGLARACRRSGAPMVVHAVQHRLYPSRRLDCWPDADTTSRLDLIGTDLPVRPIRQLFATLASRRHPWWRRKGKQ